MSDQEFHQQEQKYVQQMQDKLGLYLPKMEKQSAAATLKQLQMTSAGNYVAFQKGRAKYAVVQADRALDKNLSASSDEFYARIEQGQAGAAEGAVMGGMEAILGAAHLDKEKKLTRAKDYLVSIAQNTTDPMLIDKLQQLATRELGVNAVEVNKALSLSLSVQARSLDLRCGLISRTSCRFCKMLPPRSKSRVCRISVLS